VRQTPKRQAFSATSPPSAVPVPSLSPGESWILGTSPRMTVEGVELVAAADVGLADPDVRDRGSVAVPAGSDENREAVRFTRGVIPAGARMRGEPGPSVVKGPLAALGPGYFAARNSGMTGASARQQRVEFAGAVEGVELAAAADVGLADPDVRDRCSVAVPAGMGGVTNREAVRLTRGVIPAGARMRGEPGPSVVEGPLAAPGSRIFRCAKFRDDRRLSSSAARRVCRRGRGRGARRCRRRGSRRSRSAGRW